jgi:hypothetical protein
MNKTDFLGNQIKLLKKRADFFIALSVSLSLILIGLLAYVFRLHNQQNSQEESLSIQESKSSPYAEEVRAVIENLRYSGLEMLTNNDVSLTLDYQNKTWTLHNIHKFDQSGGIILENGNTGMCGELAAYTYKQVKPIFGNDYTIGFVKAAQSGFFLAARDSHIVLYVRENGDSLKDGRGYIIDPSFHKYGSVSEFRDYLFMEQSDTLPFMEQKNTDVSMPVHLAIPIRLKGDYLLGLAVEENEGKFNPDNFAIAIILTKRYDFSGRYLFAIRNNNGSSETFENASLAKSLLRDEQYKALKNRVIYFYDKLMR